MYCDEQCFCAVGTVAQLSLELPAKVGDVVNLPCRTALQTPVDWTYQSQPTAGDIFICYNGNLQDVYKPRFTMPVTSPGNYSLTIDSARVSDSGLYHCIEDVGIGTRHTIQLSVSPSGQFCFAIFLELFLNVHKLYKLSLIFTSAVVMLYHAQQFLLWTNCLYYE